MSFIRFQQEWWCACTIRVDNFRCIHTAKLYGCWHRYRYNHHHLQFILKHLWINRVIHTMSGVLHNILYQLKGKSSTLIVHAHYHSRCNCHNSAADFKNVYSAHCFSQTIPSPLTLPRICTRDEDADAQGVVHKMDKEVALSYLFCRMDCEWVVNALSLNNRVVRLPNNSLSKRQKRRANI